MSTERIMSRINKLLALAGDPAATQGEKENAIRMAQELMHEHQLSEAQLRQAMGVTAPASEIGQLDIDHCRPQKDIDTFIALALQKITGARCIMGRSSTWTGKHQNFTLHIIGTQTARDFSARLHGMLIIAMPAGFVKWLVDFPCVPDKATAASFYKGVSDGFIAASELGRAHADQRASQDARNAFALVVVSDKAAMNTFINKAFPSLGRGKAVSATNSAATSAGYAHGRQLDIGNQRIATPRPRLS